MNVEEEMEMPQWLTDAGHVGYNTPCPAPSCSSFHNSFPVRDKMQYSASVNKETNSSFKSPKMT